MKWYNFKIMSMRNFFILIMLAFIVSCTGYSQQTGKKDPEIRAKVTVYFFHGTHRCIGCLNAEKATVAVLDELYKNQQEDGIIEFESVNIEEPQNKELAVKYQVAWNMLLVVPSSNEKDRTELTEQAFAFGKDPDGLKPYIKSAIDPLLN